MIPEMLKKERFLIGAVGLSLLVSRPLIEPMTIRQGVVSGPCLIAETVRFVVT